MSSRSFNSFFVFIYSTKNILGCLLSLGGLALFYVDIIHNNWLLIVVGLYTIGYRLVPPRPKIKNYPQNQKTLSQTELLISLNALLRKVEKKLSPDILSLVVQIKSELDNNIKILKEIKHDFHSFHLIHQTVVDYLPTILDTYLDIPPVYSKIYTDKNGFSAKEIAIQQLELLLSQIQETSKMIADKNISKMENHHKFLKAKFS